MNSPIPSSSYIPFWFDNPNILLQPDFIHEWCFTPSMTLEQKLNAITRLILVVTLLLFVVMKKFHIILLGGLSLFFIVIFYRSHTKQDGYENVNDQIVAMKESPDSTTTQAPTVHNPFGNLTIADITENPDKLPAPLLDQEDTTDVVNERVREVIQMLNPTFPDLTERLYKGVGDQYVMEQSLRAFTSQACTTVVNDLDAYKKFCYGDMISSKEGNPFALARNNPRYETM
jgi:hypothetical protein